MKHSRSRQSDTVQVQQGCCLRQSSKGLACPFPLFCQVNFSQFLPRFFFLVVAAADLRFLKPGSALIFARSYPIAKVFIPCETYFLPLSNLFAFSINKPERQRVESHKKDHLREEPLLYCSTIYTLHLTAPDSHISFLVFFPQNSPAGKWTCFQCTLHSGHALCLMNVGY